jgi:prepilin-type N-terminal cleavage/methylation domain-containing protein
MNRRRPTGNRGFTLTELLVVMGIVALAAAATIPALDSFYRRHQLNAAATEFQALVLRARISALKEKVSYRLVLHDENASASNQFELQKAQSGSWVALDDGSHAVPDTVAILGSGSTDSVDSVTVNGRGVCTVGKVFLESERGDQHVVKLDSTCYTNE